jgi:hypothetical protein
MSIDFESKLILQSLITLTEILILYLLNQCILILAEHWFGVVFACGWSFDLRFIKSRINGNTSRSQKVFLLIAFVLNVLFTLFSILVWETTQVRYTTTNSIGDIHISELKPIGRVICALNSTRCGKKLLEIGTSKENVKVDLSRNEFANISSGLLEFAVPKNDVCGHAGPIRICAGQMLSTTFSYSRAIHQDHSVICGIDYRKDYDDGSPIWKNTFYQVGNIFWNFADFKPYMGLAAAAKERYTALVFSHNDSTPYLLTMGTQQLKQNFAGNSEFWELLANSIEDSETYFTKSGTYSLDAVIMKVYKNSVEKITCTRRLVPDSNAYFQTCAIEYFLVSYLNIETWKSPKREDSTNLLYSEYGEIVLQSEKSNSTNLPLSVNLVGVVYRNSGDVSDPTNHTIASSFHSAKSDIEKIHKLNNAFTKERKASLILTQNLILYGVSPILVGAIGFFIILTGTMLIIKRRTLKDLQGVTPDQLLAGLKANKIKGNDISQLRLDIQGDMVVLLNHNRRVTLEPKTGGSNQIKTYPLSDVEQL